MFPVFIQSGIILYGIIQVIIACTAVILAIKWKKFEFFAGLFFLLLYTIIEVINTFFFTIMQDVYIDVAQFGFILLAIIFFILGMHSSWTPVLVPGMDKPATKPKPSRNDSVITLLKKQP